MKTVKIIELIKNKEKYKVWYDFKKSEVTTEEIEIVMKKLVKRNIEEMNIYVVVFNNDEIISVEWMIEIWDNIPQELMKLYIEDFDTVQEFFDAFKEMSEKGYSMDFPYDGGSGIIEHIGSLMTWCEICDSETEDYEIMVCEKCGASYCEKCESFEHDCVCIECENDMECEETWEN